MMFYIILRLRWLIFNKSLLIKKYLALFYAFPHVTPASVPWVPLGLRLCRAGFCWWKVLRFFCGCRTVLPFGSRLSLQVALRSLQVLRRQVCFFCWWYKELWGTAPSLPGRRIFCIHWCLQVRGKTPVSGKINSRSCWIIHDDKFAVL